jgi:predicted small secreted protein
MPLPFDKDRQITIRLSKQNPDLIIRLKALAEDAGINTNKYAEKILTFAVKHFESLQKQKKKKAVPGDQIQDFIYRLLDSFYTEFEKSRGFKFLYPHSAKDRSAMGKLLSMYKKKNPNVDSEKTLQALTWFFRQAMDINEQWIKDNMSPGVMLMKINYIQTLIYNGKRNSKDAGTTPQQLNEAIQRNYPTDRENR